MAECGVCAGDLYRSVPERLPYREVLAQVTTAGSDASPQDPRRSFASSHEAAASKGLQACPFSVSCGLGGEVTSPQPWVGDSGSHLKHVPLISMFRATLPFLEQTPPIFCRFVTVSPACTDGIWGGVSKLYGN